MCVERLRVCWTDAVSWPPLHIKDKHLVFQTSCCGWTGAVLQVSTELKSWNLIKPVPTLFHTVWAETPNLNKYIFHRMTLLWWITFHSSSNQEASHREKLQGKLNWNWQKHGCWSSWFTFSKCETALWHRCPLKAGQGVCLRLRNKKVAAAQHYKENI